MKNITKIVAILSLLILGGCGKEWLAPNDELVLTVPEYYANLNEDAINNISANMYGSDWFNLLDKASSCLQELQSGNGWTNDGAYMPFFNGTLNSTFSQLDFLWTTNFGVIKNVNLSLNGLVTSLNEGGKFKDKYDSDPRIKSAVDACIGELRFFRAISYFNLVRWFGPVPVIYDNLKQLGLPDSWTPVVEEDIYKFIVQDLEDAVAKLPATRNASATYRLSKISAKALLAKVYLSRGGLPFGTESDFTQAAALADDIIKNPGGYSLSATYHENWLPKYAVGNFPTECLYGWKWSYSAPWANYGSQSTLQSYFGTSHFTQSWDGWSSVLPSIDLKESYEQGDVRRYSTIMENGNKYPEFWTEYTFPGQTTPGYVYYDGAVSYGGPTATAMSIRKHLQGRDNSKDAHITEMHGDLYTPVIRLADVYLTYTEAKLGKNTSTTDVQYFNEIRARAGLPAKSSVTYADIFKERRHEFAFEFCNWDDLLRYYHLYPEAAKSFLQNQKRGYYNLVTEPFKIDGVEQSFPSGSPLKVVASKTYVDFKLPAVNDDYFKLPYPLSEQNANTSLSNAPVKFDFNNYK